ncbi:MAG TPA: peptide deformylase [Sphaerochaeta sp.]|jgi:peptide deformylase|nr:peptide deformylase [Sphaerochaeta sp.]HPZ15289.1 peptide deformylase [Sphaerochaeta sp.]
MLDIYTLGDEILRERCKPVKTFDSALSMLVDAMFTTMAEANGVGLAAPQVGVDSRLFVVDIPDFGKRVFINPQIIETSVEVSCAEEGCLSVPGLWHDVERPSSIVVQAQDERGKVFTLKADGLLARAIQHENDHLNGVLFIDRLEEVEQQKMLKAWEKRSKRRVGG